MAVFPLYWLRNVSFTLGNQEIVHGRIFTYAEIGTSLRPPIRKDCIVDSGSPFSFFPQIDWQDFQADIQRLYRPGDLIVLPDWLCTVTGLGAASIPCGVGLIQVQLIHKEPFKEQRLPPVTILAKFPHYAGKYAKPVLGLGGGTFANHRLIIDYNQMTAWLES